MCTVGFLTLVAAVAPHKHLKHHRSHVSANDRAQFAHKTCIPAAQDFARDLRALFADVDALNMGPLLRPGADIQAAAASMAADAGVNNLMLRVSCSSSLTRLALAQHRSDCHMSKQLYCHVSHTCCHVCKHLVAMYVNPHVAVYVSIHNQQCLWCCSNAALISFAMHDLQMVTTRQACACMHGDAGINASPPHAVVKRLWRRLCQVGCQLEEFAE